MSYEAQAFYRIYLGKEFSLELNTFSRIIFLYLFPLCEYLPSQILCAAFTRLQYLLIYKTYLIKTGILSCFKTCRWSKCFQSLVMFNNGLCVHYIAMRILGKYCFNTFLGKQYFIFICSLRRGSQNINSLQCAVKNYHYLVIRN